jgi:hypothetical protein
MELRLPSAALLRLIEYLKYKKRHLWKSSLPKMYENESVVNVDGAPFKSRHQRILALRPDRTPVPVSELSPKNWKFSA